MNPGCSSPVPDPVCSSVWPEGPMEQPEGPTEWPEGPTVRSSSMWGEPVLSSRVVALLFERIAVLCVISDGGSVTKVGANRRGSSYVLARLDLRSSVVIVLTNLIAMSVDLP